MPGMLTLPVTKSHASTINRTPALMIMQRRTGVHQIIVVVHAQSNEQRTYTARCAIYTRSFLKNRPVQSVVPVDRRGAKMIPPRVIAKLGRGCKCQGDKYPNVSYMSSWQMPHKCKPSRQPQAKGHWVWIVSPAVRHCTISH